ncbi:hypothetical protein MLD38_031653 [Melastoma candidum]|uniref:Uncharacterized protein n=1 Tax=Melastoma candidum TaxID=119954 RepID=A0ACB9MRU7_9MYRT|nr:hypothetical protein MLD38_031653 [Melastoma candidum]
MERLATNSLLIPLLLLWLSVAARVASGKGNIYLQDACNVTQYHDLCVHSLASFSRTAGKSPRRWARAGVSVTIREAKGITQYMRGMKSTGSVRGKQGMVLSDCIECFQDGLDNLHQSLRVLRKLNAGKFDEQMNDVITWMSSALTDENTCFEGFGERNGDKLKVLIDKVVKVTYLTSNALALANKLASTGSTA